MMKVKYSQCRSHRCLAGGYSRRGPGPGSFSVELADQVAEDDHALAGHCQRPSLAPSTGDPWGREARRPLEALADQGDLVGPEGRIVIAASLLAGAVGSNIGCKREQLFVSFDLPSAKMVIAHRRYGVSGVCAPHSIK